MQENEFEKQVKLKMDEFRLHPSEPVWPEIERELRDKRRKRFILIPLLAVLLMSGYFAWIHYFTGNKISSSAMEISAKKNTHENNNSVDAGNDNNKINTPSQKKVDIPEYKNTVATNIKGIAVATNQPGKIKKENTNRIAGNKKKENRAIISLTGIKKAGHPAYKDTRVKTRNEYQINNQHENEMNIPGQSAVTDNYITQPGQNNPLIKEVPADSNEMRRDKEPVLINTATLFNKLSVDSISSARLLSLQLPSPGSPDHHGESNKVKFGIAFSAGASSRVNKTFKVNSSEKSAAATAYLNAGPLYSTAGVGISILPPSDVKPGAAFKVGAIAMKSISKRIDVSAGLLYSYTSDHIQVGKSIGNPGPVALYGGNSRDVMIQAYYPNVQNGNHTNKYHFIELPVSISFNLNNRWRIPIIWNAGVSVSRLISADVLLYDITWGGIYYNGNNDMLKTQVNISTGFSFRFTGNNRWQWNIGPQVYMGTTNLFQNTYDKNKHPVYGGLGVQLLLPGKKKYK